MKELFYEFNIHSPGQFQRYGLTLFNSDGLPKDVTFAFKLIKAKPNKTDQSPADAAKSSDEAAMFSYLDESNQDLGHFMTESKFQNFRMLGYISTIRNSTEQTLYLTVIEIVVMLGLGVFQVFYLKRVLDNKRMI